MFAPYDVQNDRFNTCRKCKFFKKKTNTCGTPIIGNKVKYNKKEYKLCGCFMDIKSRLRYARCPLNKWKDNIKLSLAEYTELKELLSHSIDKVTREQNRDLAILHRKYFNSDAKPSSCAPCVLGHINDLHKVIDQYEK
tara:strand:- start:1718 stop:2131 length:414 start_codon:yes stop_codon:yes gene_type:complete